MTDLEEKPKTRGWIRWIFSVRGLIWCSVGLFVLLLVVGIRDDAYMADLRKNNPQAYLSELKYRNGTEWMIELKRLDPEAFEMEMKKRQPTINKIVAELKTIPASQTEKNIELYKRLTKLDPTNEAFADKLKHYEDQLREEQIAASVTDEIKTGFCRGTHSIMKNRILPARFGPAGGVMADREGGCRVEGDGRARWVNYGYTTALHRSNGVSTRYRALVDYDVSRDSYLMCILIWDDGEREVITRGAAGRCPP